MLCLILLLRRWWTEENLFSLLEKLAAEVNTEARRSIFPAAVGSTHPPE